MFNSSGVRRHTPGGTRRRRLAAACVTIAVLASMAACKGANQAAAQAPSRGGTLNIYLTARAITNLDPQEISWATDSNFSRLIDRTLTTTTPGGDLIPDLATDTGRPSDNNTVWEFTLKNDVKWQDGTPITCDDVKYGIERRYAKVISDAGGLPYPLLYLKDNKPAYAGPYNGDHLNSIVCVDQRTVQFHLQRAVGDFGYTVSVSTFAPVQPGSDTDRGTDATSFNFQPTSSGPYKIDVANTKTALDQDGTRYFSTLTLVRNPYWVPGTDSLRKAYPDKIVTTFDPDNAKVTNDLINSTGADRTGINLDQNVAPNFVQQVINDPELSKRAFSGSGGGLRYAAINVKNVPDLKCRQALEYGFDKRTWRFVLGGAVSGDLATSMIPTGLPAHADFDLYETKTFPDGDPTKAIALMKGANCKSTLSVAYPDIPIYHQLVSTVIDAYAPIGIVVKASAISPQNYTAVIGNPTNTYDMMISGWVPDWPNGSAVIPPLFDGAQTHGPAESNENFSELDDPEINQMIQQAYAEPDLQTQYHLWGQLDEKLMQEAAAIPIVFQDALRMAGSDVRGVVMASGYGEPDLCVIGLGSATS